MSHKPRKTRTRKATAVYVCNAADGLVEILLVPIGYDGKSCAATYYRISKDQAKRLAEDILSKTT